MAKENQLACQSEVEESPEGQVLVYAQVPPAAARSGKSRTCTDLAPQKVPTAAESSRAGSVTIG